MRTEMSAKWVRAYVGRTVVVDSRAPMLFYEDGFPVPGYAFADTDVRLDLLRPTEEGPVRRSAFHLPKGPVRQWYDIELAGRRIRHAAWRRAHPAVEDRLVLSWQPGVLDRWTEEDEEVVEHPRDPHARVEALASSRHVRISLDGILLADTRRPVLLFETHLPTRYYVPRSDVIFDDLDPSATHSRCPYKGSADEYWSVRGRPDAANIAWSYAAPLPAVAKIAGRVAFYNEMVDIAVDGVPEERPVTSFSSPADRPGAMS